jgi:hypothetical protein
MGLVSLQFICAKEKKKVSGILLPVIPLGYSSYGSFSGTKI